MSFTANDCSILHNGTFTYKDEDGEPILVVIDDNKHTEYHKNKKYTIQSTIKWINNCEYHATLVKATLPNFPFKKGTVMKVAIDKVDGDDIYLACSVNGSKFESKLTKKKEATPVED
ncbi:hypothetical protein OGH69_16370 [Flavobacterium sp. MFBS3-15]|uniref:hypothetical protein n=1 Tax=Flavobacterium sp. MFBS3-15 TaxID=2989816 RepID=UPI0022355123|nr:hypothetical protein [Flavobacterium sp. MFBS3-15]MCW4470547.1 hypothetical protein [Flavobacterium sp. MFBS3-15]